MNVSSLKFGSLCRKHLQSSYCTKVRVGAKNKWKGEGEGRRGNTCPETLRFWKAPLDISWFCSFVNWQLVNIEASITDYCNSLIKHVPHETVVWNYERLLRNFLFFIVKFNLERYVALSHLKSCQTSQSNDLSRTLHSAGYECYRVADHHRPASVKKLSTIHAAKFPINKKNLFISTS